MKKALTLIELIFTIVIIAFTFTVIPKLFQISNNSISLTSKEDALFNMYSQIMDIVIKEYDEKNTIYDDILLTGQNSLECNASSGYRIGGFIGGRNCFDKVYESNIGLDADEPPRDDIDDYNNLEYTISSGHKTYTLRVTVGYSDNWDENSYTDKTLNFNFTNRSNNTKSQIKRVYVKILDNNQTISSVYYYSANIGHATIKSIKW